MDNATYEEPTILNVNVGINYIQTHFIQILLFAMVFVIIYAVDYIAHINMVLYSMPSSRMIGLHSSPVQGLLKHRKKIKK